jgi:hypothetical protein
MAWAATVSILRTARRFRNWFIVTAVSGSAGLVTVAIIPNLEFSDGRVLNSDGVAALALLTYVSTYLLMLAGAFLIAWFLTTLFGRHAEVVYFSGSENIVRDRKKLSTKPTENADISL